MEFYEKLIDLRKSKGITQEKLAEELNVSRQAVSKWESGRTMPEVDKIIELSNIFSVPIDTLIKDNQEQCTHRSVEQKPDRNNRKNHLLAAGLIAIGGIIGIMVLLVISIIKDISFFNFLVIRNEFLVLFISFCAIIIGSIIYYLNIKGVLNFLKTGLLLLGMSLLFEVFLFFPIITVAFKYKVDIVYSRFFYNNMSTAIISCFLILNFLGFCMIFKSRQLKRVRFGMLIFTSGIALFNLAWVFIMPLLINNITYKSSIYRFAITLYNNHLWIVSAGFAFLVLISFIVQIVINLHSRKK